MKIIMLTGEPDTGKTSTLYFVLEMLFTNGAKINLIEHIGSADQRDFSSVMEYRGKSIRIFTMGDIEDEDEKCKKDLQKALDDTRPNFLICACNYGDDEIINKADYQLEKTEARIDKKTLAKTDACMLAANRYDANRIIELLDKSIK